LLSQRLGTPCLAALSARAKRRASKHINVILSLTVRFACPSPLLPLCALRISITALCCDQANLLFPNPPPRQDVKTKKRKDGKKKGFT
jgi:hypothetical protein